MGEITINLKIIFKHLIKTLFLLNDINKKKNLITIKIFTNYNNIIITKKIINWLIFTETSKLREIIIIIK